MIEIKLNEYSAEDVKAIQELKAMGFSDEQIQKWYDNSHNADIAEVIRCKDCKQAEELPSGLFRCKLHSVYTAFYDSVFNVKADDFCSYGERKE